jgi:hypothetical protein
MCCRHFQTIVVALVLSTGQPSFDGRAFAGFQVFKVEVQHVICSKKSILCIQYLHKTYIQPISGTYKNYYTQEELDNSILSLRTYIHRLV